MRTTGSWRPEDFGVFLKRSSAWQKGVQARGGHMDYNEIVLSGTHWNAHLPGTIEAFFTTSKDDAKLARDQRRMFVNHYALDPSAVPLLVFDSHNWLAPFRELNQ